MATLPIAQIQNDVAGVFLSYFQRAPEFEAMQWYSQLYSRLLEEQPGVLVEAFMTDHITCAREGFLERHQAGVGDRVGVDLHADQNPLVRAGEKIVGQMVGPQIKRLHHGALVVVKRAHERVPVGSLAPA